MLFDARKIYETQTYPRSEALEEKEALAYVDKKQRRRRRQLLGAQAALLAATTAFGSYWIDVEENREKQASSEAAVSVYDTPLSPENDSSAVIFFNGFGTYDADSIADTFGPGIKQSVDGESWSVSYGNAPLNSRKIADKIETLAQERDVDTIDIVGYSAGGVIGIDTAAELSESQDLTVRSITAVSTPDGIDGLREYQRRELEFADTFANIPGAKYSTAIRFAGEVYFMRDRYDHGSPLERLHNLGKSALMVADNIQHPKFPGTWLLVDQALAIAEADVQSNLEKISQDYTGTKPSPTLLYIGTAEPGRDYMVDNEASSINICGYAHSHGMACSIHDVPGAVHTMPERTAEEYTRTLAEAGVDFMSGIENAHSRHESKAIRQQMSLAHRAQLNQ